MKDNGEGQAPPRHQKAGQMALVLEKLQDSSSGLCFLQDSQVLEGQAPPRELQASSPGLLQSKFLLSVLIIPYFQSFKPSQMIVACSASLLCKQPCLGGPEPRHPQNQPQHQVCYKKTDLMLVIT